VLVVAVAVLVVVLVVVVVVVVVAVVAVAAAVVVVLVAAVVLVAVVAVAVVVAAAAVAVVVVAVLVAAVVLVAVAVGEFAICQVMNRTALEGLGGFARQVQPRMRAVFERTGGATNAKVARSSQVARGGSGYAYLGHLENKMGLQMVEGGLVLAPALATHEAEVADLHCLVQINQAGVVLALGSDRPAVGLAQILLPVMVATLRDVLGSCRLYKCSSALRTEAKSRSWL
jgi:hypothetical protein